MGMNSVSVSSQDSTHLLSSNKDFGRMPTEPREEDRHREDAVQMIPSPADYSQPWWHRIKHGVMSSFGEKIRVSNGVDEDTVSSTVPQSGLNANDGQDQQQVERVETDSPMEPVGHSVVLTSYPYQDPHYAGMISYGTPLAHPQYLGIHQTRMPLPLQMEEEPVYVNAKQYHGILRRRQSRAKAELEKKVTKSRKPYLHESRHQHAIRRARGCGGRFLNTKKVNNEVSTDSSQQKESRSVQHMSLQSFNSRDSDHLPTNSSIFEDMLKINNSSNGNFNLICRERLHYFKREKGNMVNQFL